MSKRFGKAGGRQDKGVARRMEKEVTNNHPSFLMPEKMEKLINFHHTASANHLVKIIKMLVKANMRSSKIK